MEQLIEPQVQQPAQLGGLALRRHLAELIQWEPSPDPPLLLLQEAEGGPRGRFQLQAGGLRALGG